MKIRTYAVVVVCLSGLLCFPGAQPSRAQMYPQPPIMAPYTPGYNFGVFYFRAGVKYRSIDSLRLDVIGVTQTLIANPGTIPFGPTTAGNFGVGTGIPGFTGGAGNSWDYDNGQISGDVDPNGGTSVDCPPPNFFDPAIPTVCDESGVPRLCTPCDKVWTYSLISPLLGRFHSTGVGGCCDGLDIAFSEGSFSVLDTVAQMNSTSIGDTTATTFQRVLQDSLAFLVNTTPAINRETGPDYWAPAFEAGYELSSYFNVFTGFSWFSVSKSTGVLNVIQGQGARVMIQDTFPFTSDHFGANWPVSNFNSSNLVISGEEAHNYNLATNSPLRGILPNRQFLTQIDATIVTESIQETVNDRVHIDVYESRFGGRSWAPLYGMGRLGATVGGSFMPAFYRVTENRKYTSLGPNVPGRVLFYVSTEHTDCRPHYGLFVGGDLELGTGAFFVNGSIDYMWATTQTYQLEAVEASFNPGGMTVGATAGLHF